MCTVMESYSVKQRKPSRNLQKMEYDFLNSTKHNYVFTYANHSCAWQVLSAKDTMKLIVIQPCPTLCKPMNYIAFQAPLSLGFSRQEYWSGLPFPSPGDLPDPRCKPGSPALQTITIKKSKKFLPTWNLHSSTYTYTHSYGSSLTWTYV